MEIEHQREPTILREYEGALREASADKPHFAAEAGGTHFDLNPANSEVRNGCGSFAF